ncbi:hypothetical protein PF008_g11282 [Phytophthora fragariae]|uniref:Uncharacterized protein n=1 Tax=Phytophthora fragariae TaxID=53985 RepID=A0A6G0RR67_9STRA|nr:hypothetical protein PF008_g11282 [Phytophthora fragariae]
MPSSSALPLPHSSALMYMPSVSILALLRGTSCMSTPICSRLCTTLMSTPSSTMLPLPQSWVFT